jgi:formate dehydrogenase subunit gamma
MNGSSIPDGDGAGEIGRIVAACASGEGALLPVLHAIQKALGFVPPIAVPVVADALNLSRAEVHGVLSFYHDFRTAPLAKPLVRLCRAEACQARGSEPLAARIERDQRVTVETVYCLGLCASGPAAIVDGRIVARLDAGSLGRLIAEAAP